MMGDGNKTFYPCQKIVFEIKALAFRVSLLLRNRASPFTGPNNLLRRPPCTLCLSAKSYNFNESYNFWLRAFVVSNFPNIIIVHFYWDPH